MFSDPAGGADNSPVVLRRRFALTLTAAGVAGIAAAAITVSGSSAATRPLASLLVRASQVGPGYRARQEIWDKSSSAPSLTCRHIRDNDRAGRAVGDEYTKSRASAQLFNVLFSYRSPTGAADDLALIRRILAVCPSVKLVVKSPQTKITYTFSLTQLATPSGLLQGSVAVREVTTETGARPTQSIDIYQPDGKILSLTYAFGRHVRQLRELTARVAQASASNLG